MHTETEVSNADKNVSRDVSPASIMAAAKTRWPQWGPWKITLTYHENGTSEYQLFGSSPAAAKFENRVRIGRNLEELARRVFGPD